MLAEQDWSESTNIDGVPCHLAQVGSQWLIASSKSPRFCLAATSPASAIALAERAVQFFRKFEREQEVD
jgi:hypothetical protein